MGRELACSQTLEESVYSGKVGPKSTSGFNGFMLHQAKASRHSWTLHALVDVDEINVISGKK